MKNDARILLNKRKWENKAFNRVSNDGRIMKSGTQGAYDARKILNLKRFKKITSNQRESFVGSFKTSRSALPVIKKSFSYKTPEKQVELASDGNIWITSQSKDTPVVTNPSQRIPDVNRHLSSRQMRWQPSELNMDNIEHVGIDDLMDMDALPPTLMSTNIQPSGRAGNPHRSLAEEVLAMPNTMVADQIASASSTVQTAHIIVTNLHTSVSKQDIMELFGDVGLVKNVEMTQPGTAIIEFYNKEDASRACGIYHNRLLDAQPMKCYIQPIMNCPPRTSVSQRLGARIQGSSSGSRQSSSTFTYDARSRLNPRDVRFTVKLI